MCRVCPLKLYGTPGRGSNGRRDEVLGLARVVPRLAQLKIGTICLYPIFRDDSRKCSAGSFSEVSGHLNDGRSFNGIYSRLRRGNVGVVLSKIFGRINESFFTFYSMLRGGSTSRCGS